LADKYEIKFCLDFSKAVFRKFLIKKKEVEKMWGQHKEHMMGGSMMSEKMMEMMSKEDMMMLYGMKLDKKIAMLEVKLDFYKKMKELLEKKM